MKPNNSPIKIRVLNRVIHSFWDQRKQIAIIYSNHYLVIGRNTWNASKPQKKKGVDRNGLEDICKTMLREELLKTLQDSQRLSIKFLASFNLSVSRTWKWVVNSSVLRKTPTLNKGILAHIYSVRYYLSAWNLHFYSPALNTTFLSFFPITFLEIAIYNQFIRQTIFPSFLFFIQLRLDFFFIFSCKYLFTLNKNAHLRHPLFFF